MDSSFYEIAAYGFLALFLWPYLFIKLKKGTHRFLFVSTVFGILVLTAILLYLVAFPVNFFAIKLLPQFEAMGVPSVWLMYAPIEFVGDWFAIIFYPMLFFALPFMVFKRYSIFRLTSSSSSPASRAGNAGDKSPTFH